MNINFGDASKDGSRKITVTDENGDTLFEGSAPDIDAAHKLVKQGRKDGWDTITPEALAAATKADTAKSKKAVEKGKAEAEPEK